MSKTKLTEHIGHRIAILRNEKGFTQDSLARALGLCRAQIGRIEHGEGGLNLNNLYKMATLFNTNIGNILPDYHPDSISNQYNERLRDTIDRNTKLRKKLAAIRKVVNSD